MASIVITGANRGIGFHLAQQYVESGDHVLALCRQPDLASALKNLATENGGRLTIGRLDLNDAGSIPAAAALAVEQVDVLINNAGIGGGERQSLEDIDYEAWHEAFEVMAIAPLRVVNAFRTKLVAGSKVITISSQIAASTWPYGGYYIYASAKAASNRIMQGLAKDLSQQEIAVASIHPGYVKTDMGGPNAEITPEESARGVRQVIKELTMGQSGGFFKWTGEAHPL